MRGSSRDESLSVLWNPTADWNRAHQLCWMAFESTPTQQRTSSFVIMPKPPAPLMGTDLAAILISSVFLGVGSVIAKFFPEASLMAAVFLIGLAILNITLALLAWLIHSLKLDSDRKKKEAISDLPMFAVSPLSRTNWLLCIIQSVLVRRGTKPLFLIKFSLIFAKAWKGCATEFVFLQRTTPASTSDSWERQLWVLNWANGNQQSGTGD